MMASLPPTADADTRDISPTTPARPPRRGLKAHPVAPCGFADPGVERGEVDVERLRRWTLSPRLHVLGVRREAFWWLNTDTIRCVDNRLAFDSPHVVEGLGYRSAGDRYHNGLGVRDVAALAPDPVQLVSGLLR